MACDSDGPLTEALQSALVQGNNPLERPLLSLGGLRQKDLRLSPCVQFLADARNIGFALYHSV